LREIFAPYPVGESDYNVLMDINFQKYPDGLVPTIVQDSRTQKVLMLGFMNTESLKLTQTSGKATFYSRSRQRLWTKGESSGNFLKVDEILIDCDSDTILIKAAPSGPVCHTGSDTCFGEKNEHEDFLFRLEDIIKDRKLNPKEDSYTCKLFEKGLNKITQKVGEEAVELIIEAKDSDDKRFKAEAADLLYHLLVLFAAKNVELREVLKVLREREP
jgi:phosphoribosyl-AMP cyclohydrolase / phosphoribosyl-ATP pyrophosphohydrolase